MALPPDEADQTTGEIQMNFSAEGISSVDVIGEGEINPV